MSVFVSTSCLKGGRDALTVIRKYVDAGIRSIELGSAHASTAGLNEILAIPGLRVAAHGAFSGMQAPRGASLFSRNAAYREAAIQQTEESIRLSAALGAAFYSFHPIAPGDTEMDEEEGIKALTRIARLARDLGVEVGIENVHYGDAGGTGYADRAGQLLRLINAAGGYTLRVLIDLGHLKLAAAQGGVDPAAFIRTLAPHALAVHAHDNDGHADAHLAIARGGEPASWLNMPEMAGLPVILETTRQTMDEIVAQAALLETIIAGRAG